MRDAAFFLPPHRAPGLEPSPSKGEGWDGVRAPWLRKEALGAPLEPFHRWPALTPIPDPSPFEGEGGVLPVEGAGS